MEHVRNGEIVLNIGPLAASRLKMGNDVIECSARFAGVAKELIIPVVTVTSIHARETGQGMSFEREKALDADTASETVTATPEPRDPPKAGRPALKRIK
jgi:stringent starvation protein B